MNARSRAAALAVVLVLAAVLAAWGIVHISFPAPSLLVLAAASGIAAIAGLRAGPRFLANRASESANAEHVPLQKGCRPFQQDLDAVQALLPCSR